MVRGAKESQRLELARRRNSGTLNRVRHRHLTILHSVSQRSRIKGLFMGLRVIFPLKLARYRGEWRT